jgi:hypothetical protein
MPITYPETPSIVGKTLPKKFILPFGEGLNCFPLEADVELNFDAKVGDATLGYYKTIAMLGRLGFKVFKIDESIEVTPVAREYYQLTIAQKEQMEAQIKSHLASISTALSDLDLLKHDLRKYKEFMDYYSMREEGKKLIEKGKIEEGKKLMLQGEQSLKSIFIDQVDVHTGETVALKLIAPRWPTIIADFMRLEDEDVEPKKIKEKYKVSEAEAVVLATKNKLYIEWRDRLFKPAVEERFKNLISLVEARKKSVEEYKNMVRPLMRRYKAITQALEKGPVKLRSLWVWRPGAQALSLDEARLWAWKPFAPAEKYKRTVETFSTIKPCGVVQPFDIGAGFWPEEIEEIKESLRKKVDKGGSLSYAEELLLKNDLVEALPVEPSIDPVVRRFIGDIEKYYGVEITPMDLFEARQRLIEDFKSSLRGGGPEMWVFSPYFIFLDMSIQRVHSTIVGGAEQESLNVKLTAATQTQNIIILHYLELIAREKQIEKYVSEMLGEVGVSGKSLEEIEKELMFKVEKLETKKKVDIKKPRYSLKERILKPLRDFFLYFGIEVPMFTIGPYEFALTHRITKFYQAQVAKAFEQVKDLFKSRFKVPGAQERVMI